LQTIWIGDEAPQIVSSGIQIVWYSGHSSILFCKLWKRAITKKHL